MVFVSICGKIIIIVTLKERENKPVELGGVIKLINSGNIMNQLKNCLGSDSQH